jgi:hypothetical protein
LGKAAKIARQLELGFMGWREKDRERIFEVGFNITVWTTVAYFVGELSGDALDFLKSILGRKMTGRTVLVRFILRRANVSRPVRVLVRA